MFTFVFWDLDDTLLDFKACEQEALRAALRLNGIEMTESILSRYSAINDSKWKLFERGEITRAMVQLTRFEDFFREFGWEISASDFNNLYLEQLALQAVEFPGIHEMLGKLQQRYQQFIASNGVERVMRSRMAIAGLDQYFVKAFSSEFMGVQKPDKAFFDTCCAQIPGFDPKKAIIIGDSLSSDIQGGINAGIATCWFNPKFKPLPEGIKPDYEIHSLDEIYTILPI
ncbi:MAG: noncanonical pyrimidine nucleotidase, YjjG family [Ruminococcaceae bacterium]|nr:noncanonical pyrimidine nucleotidase, YjjG family [Oscillospiraceae bacterium]